MGAELEMMVDRTSGLRYIEQLSEVSLSLHESTGLKSFATTVSAANWGQVLAAVQPATVTAFVERMYRVQDRGLWTDTTTLFDVAELTLGKPFRPWSYIHWAMRLPETEFTLLSGIGCCTDLSSQRELAVKLKSKATLFESPAHVVAVISGIRRPVEAEWLPPLHHYAADVMSQLGVARCLELAKVSMSGRT